MRMLFRADAVYILHFVLAGTIREKFNAPISIPSPSI
jgi:hypothetical protein